MRYVEYKPAAALRDYVRCYWICEDTSIQLQRDVEELSPDGCPEIVLHYAAAFAEYDDSGRAMRQPAAVVAGQLTGPLRLQPGESIGMLGIRLEPATACTLLGVPAFELTNRRLDLSVCWGSEAGRLLESLATAVNDRQRIEVCERELLQRLCVSGYERDELVEAVVGRIQRRSGDISMDELERLSGYSARHLERRFRQRVGVSPKLFGRIIRFRRIFDELTADGPAEWVRIALDRGFYDQSHLIRDFRQFAGCTPTQFLATQSNLSRCLLELGDA